MLLYQFEVEFGRLRHRLKRSGLRFLEQILGLVKPEVEAEYLLSLFILDTLCLVQLLHHALFGFEVRRLQLDPLLVVFRHLVFHRHDCLLQAVELCLVL